ncbi:hypothetical protein PENSPDRAFT_189606 [Peniophora sp. CONT]|nr:hypothetical protein PENSPDRAFT_189606 [Peniophora sp. CONT]
MTLTAQDLPHDILRELFEHLAIVDPAGWHLRSRRCSLGLGWITATHVCRYWREIGLEMATLWADVVCAFPDIAVADELLRRARDCLLNIDVSFFRGTFLLGEHRPYLPMSWGLQQLHRAHTFQGYIYRWSTFADDHPGAYVALNNTLPVLKHLKLTFNCCDKIDPFPIIALNAPALISADLRDILPHSTSITGKLTKLSISLGSTTSWNNLSPLLDALRSSRHLEYLNVQLDAKDTVPVVDCSIVHLERLTTLHASCGTAQQASDLLEFISAPCLKRTSVSMMTKLTDAHIFAKVLAQQPLLVFDDLSVSETHLCIADHTLQYREFDMSWFARDPVLRRGIGSNYASVLAALPRLFDFTRFDSFELSCLENGEQHDEVDASLLALRDACTGVEFLRLYDTPHPTTLRMLLAPTGGSPLPFPSLKTLCLGAEHWRHGKGGWRRLVHEEDSAASWWNPVKDVLSSRFEMGAPVELLYIDGEWCTHHARMEEWAAQSAECLSRGLVQEVVDDRDLVLKCSLCYRI